MSINRVGQLVAPQPSDGKRRRQEKLLDLLLSAGVSSSIQEHRQKHPGEQCYVTVLDTQECIVQDLLRWVNPQLLEALPDQVMQMGAAEGGKRPDMGLWVQVLPRALGIHVATFLAKDEPAMQALCDRLQDDVIVVGLACGGMWLEPLCAPKAGALAAAERGRRQDRARRAGR
jgi:hypothetical protein